LRVIIDRRGDRYVKELSDPQTGQLLQSVRKRTERTSGARFSQARLSARKESSPELSPKTARASGVIRIAGPR